MAYELARAAVQKIFQDKIIMGLVIIAILGIFVGGFTSSEHKENKPAASSGAGAPPVNGTPVPASQTSDLDPKLASSFTTWWLARAMDYDRASTEQSHSEAAAWLDPEATTPYQSIFWSPDLASRVTSGSATARFTLQTAQPVAINPDGSIVVTVAGTMMLELGGPPAPQPFTCDFLVRREADGLRIASIYNRGISGPYASIF